MTFTSAIDSVCASRSMGIVWTLSAMTQHQTSWSEVKFKPGSLKVEFSSDEIVDRLSFKPVRDASLIDYTSESNVLTMYSKVKLEATIKNSAGTIIESGTVFRGFVIRPEIKDLDHQVVCHSRLEALRHCYADLNLQADRISIAIANLETITEGGITKYVVDDAITEAYVGGSPDPQQSNRRTFVPQAYQVLRQLTIAITGADASGEWFEVSGDVHTGFETGQNFTVSGSTGDDGSYTCSADATYNGVTGKTRIFVVDVPVGTGTGNIIRDENPQVDEDLSQYFQIGTDTEDYFVLVGTPPSPWPDSVYVADLRVYQEGTNEIEEVIEAVLTITKAQGGAEFSAGELDLKVSGNTINQVYWTRQDGSLFDLLENILKEHSPYNYKLFEDYNAGKIVSAYVVQAPSSDPAAYYTTAISSVSSGHGYTVPAHFEQMRTRAIVIGEQFLPGNQIETVYPWDDYSFVHGYKELRGSASNLIDGVVEGEHDFQVIITNEGYAFREFWYDFVVLKLTQEIELWKVGVYGGHSRRDEFPFGIWIQGLTDADWDASWESGGELLLAEKANLENGAWFDIGPNTKKQNIKRGEYLEESDFYFKTCRYLRIVMRQAKTGSRNGAWGGRGFGLYETEVYGNIVIYGEAEISNDLVGKFTGGGYPGDPRGYANRDDTSKTYLYYPDLIERILGPTSWAGVPSDAQFNFGQIGQPEIDKSISHETVARNRAELILKEYLRSATEMQQKINVNPRIRTFMTIPIVDARNSVNTTMFIEKATLDETKMTVAGKDYFDNAVSGEIVYDYGTHPDI